MSDIENFQVEHAQILYILDLGVKKFKNILLTLSKFHEKTPSRSGDLKNVLPERRICMYTLSSIYGRSFKLRKSLL